MGYSVIMHWLLGLAIYTEEIIANDDLFLSRYVVSTPDLS